MTHPSTSERTAPVIKTQDDQTDWDRFYSKCVLAKTCRFQARPTASNETSDTQNLKLYHKLKYNSLPTVNETQYAYP